MGVSSDSLLVNIDFHDVGGGQIIVEQYNEWRASTNSKAQNDGWLVACRRGRRKVE